MQISQIVSEISSGMHQLGVVADREQMERYMKNKFPFFGVKSVARKSFQKKYYDALKDSDAETIIELSKELWHQPQRELHYIACDFLVRSKKKFIARNMTDFEYFITHNSWWDTVDAIASNLVGDLIYRYPAIRDEWIEKWMSSSDFWLVRTAIIHQLKYKENTDVDLLFALVESQIGSKEFFVNKASGWALRQASKFYPVPVKEFVNNHPQLSGLTKREATKYL